MNPFSSAPLGLAGRILYAGENPSGKSLDRNIPDDRFGLSAFRKSGPGSGSDRSRLFYDHMVFPRLSGGHPDRLLVFAEADRAAGLSDGSSPCSRHDLLCYAWHHSGRENGLCAFLSASRSEENNSEHQALMRTSYAVFSLKTII